MTREITAIMRTLTMAAAANEGSMADNPTFETEDEALNHARNIARLRHGDEVFTKCQGEDPKRGVYAGPANGGRRAMVLTFNSEERDICFMEVPWANLRLSA